MSSFSMCISQASATSPSSLFTWHNTIIWINWKYLISLSSQDHYHRLIDTTLSRLLQYTTHKRWFLSLSICMELIFNLSSVMKCQQCSSEISVIFLFFIYVEYQVMIEIISSVTIIIHHRESRYCTSYQYLVCVLHCLNCETIRYITIIIE